MEAIKNLRKEHRLNQSRFAKKIGVSRSWISQVEKGDKKISFKLTTKIAEIFGVTIDSLVCNAHTERNLLHPRPLSGFHRKDTILTYWKISKSGLTASSLTAMRSIKCFICL